MQAYLHTHTVRDLGIAGKGSDCYATVRVPHRIQVTDKGSRYEVLFNGRWRKTTGTGMAGRLHVPSAPKGEQWSVSFAEA